jgi:hypothetical protein
MEDFLGNEADRKKFKENGGNPIVLDQSIPSELDILENLSPGGKLSIDTNKINQKSVFKDTKSGEPVVVKNDFVFSGKKNCVIRFVETNNKMPKLKKPEKYHYDARHLGVKNEKYRWLLSSEQLNLEETEALSICFRKNNRQYNLNRVVLQNIINGKINKPVKEAIKLRK